MRGPGVIHVSPFSGDTAICPKYEDSFMVGAFNQKVEMTRTNGTRMWKALYPPPSTEIVDYYFDGYEDAERFLLSKNYIWIANLITQI